MSPEELYPVAPTPLLRASLIFLVVLLCSQPIFPAITLDPTFGPGGRVMISFPDTSTNYTAFGQRIFVQPSGRIVAGGMFTNRGPDGQFQGVAFVGLTSTGGLDSGYGTGGIVTDWNPIAVTTFSDAYMYPDGKVIRVSQFLSLSGPNNAKVARLNADGTNDDTFSTNINVIGTTNTIPLEVSVRSDGKILVLVYAQTSPATFHLFRLNTDGSRDTTFGTNGQLLMNFGRVASASLSYLMEVLPDGRILIGGNIGNSVQGAYPEFFLLRLSPDGHADKSFGRQGVLRMRFGASATGFVNNIYLQSDGRILLVGGMLSGDMDTWMRRFSANGKPDGNFGSAGEVVTDFTPNEYDSGYAVAFSSDGKIRICGESGSIASFLIARYSAAGTLEESTTTAFTPGEDSAAFDLTIQSDGKLLAIGYTRNPNATISGNVWAIARYTE